MSSLQILPLSLLALLLGCGPQVHKNTGFWRGAWAVDGAAMGQDEGLKALPEGARPLAAALIAELAPQIHYEFTDSRFTRLSPQGRVSVSCEVSEAEGAAQIRLEGGRALEVQEVEAGLILKEGGLILPLKRAEVAGG